MYKDDTIFLLSVEEYKKYKNRIPSINCWWWLRSPGDSSSYAAGVYSSIYNSGAVDAGGLSVYRNDGAVRPALKFSNPDWFSDSGKKYKIGDRIIAYQFPWIIIDEDLAIAEVPIAFHEFDSNSNDYETSKIRQFLLNWIKER